VKDSLIGAGALALAVSVVAAGYVLHCAVRPFRDCWLCKGTGHHRAAGNRKLSRPCRWCKATGKRLRLGRRAWNRFARIRKAAL
jgi:hypothetical protein